MRVPPSFSGLGLALPVGLALPSLGLGFALLFLGPVLALPSRGGVGASFSGRCWSFLLLGGCWLFLGWPFLLLGGGWPFLLGLWVGQLSVVIIRTTNKNQI